MGDVAPTVSLHCFLLFPVTHREPRSIVLCLLDVARIGYRFGMDPPSLIRMEREIEREERLETCSTVSSSDR